MPTKRHLLTHISLGLLLVLLGSTLQAEQKRRFGDYDVHYSVLNSTFLQPEVARRYGITRGAERAVVNIAVRKQLDDGSSAPQAVTISGESSDLIHTTPLDFHEVNEQNAIYYLAELDFMDKEIRSFTIRVQPEPGIAPYTLKFTQRLYADP